MLTNIKLKNFRAFQQDIDIRIRPITILIGRNSAGKSTLIKFLLMLQQTLESSEGEFFSTEGRHVSLGTFKDLKNTLSLDKSLIFSLDSQSLDLPDLLIQQIREDMENSEIKQNLTNESVELNFKLRTSIPSPYKYPAQGEFRISGKIPYGNSTKGNHAVYATVFDLTLESLFFRSKLNIPLVICLLIIKNRTLVKLFNSDNLRLTKFLKFSLTNCPPQDFFKFTLDNSYLDTLRREIISIRHLSPVREESERSVIMSSPPADDVGHRGEYAMPHLQRLLTDGGEKANFVLRHIESVIDIEDIKFKSQVKGFIPEFRAKNKLTGAESYLADFGFGVSQCIPIFVQGALLNRGQLLIVEQPEAQIHPTAQLAMGSFFAELWTERGVPSLIETHSSNLILRLRRLVSDKQLKADDISVAFFYVENEVVKVKNLAIRENGSLEKGLPMEFFGADVLEALEF